MSLTKKLRRIALNQQGLLKSDSFGRGKNAVRRAIEHIGYVQIDTISVVERAHHHVLWSRVSNFRPKFLDQLVAERKVFEYWFHAAAWLPMCDYRFVLPRMQSIRCGEEKHWTQNSNRKLRRHILERIREEGPLRARDFEDTRTGKKEWWDWKPAKHALEELFMCGEIMATSREGFQKVYDITERVLPAETDTQPPTLEEYAGYLIDTNLRAHGFATQKSLTYLRKGKAIRQAVADIIACRLETGDLVSECSSDGEQFYACPEQLEMRAPSCRANARLLSPFDNTVIQRERGRSVFNFDYQIECYVPAPKRQHGYFCLPILYRDQLVGRADCKAHRKDHLFQIKYLLIEKPVDDAFTVALADAIAKFAQFNQCDEIRFDNVYPTELKAEIESQLRNL